MKKKLEDCMKLSAAQPASCKNDKNNHFTIEKGSEEKWNSGETEAFITEVAARRKFLLGAPDSRWKTFGAAVLLVLNSMGPCS